MSRSPSRRLEAFEEAIAGAFSLKAGDPRAAFALLERADVLGQRDVGTHFRVHFRMLDVAMRDRDWREVRGQVLRIILVPLGHLVGRLPFGNTGGANVSAFEPMRVPPDLKRLLDSD